TLPIRERADMTSNGSLRADRPRNRGGRQLRDIKQRTPRRPAGLFHKVVVVVQGQKGTNRWRGISQHWSDDGINTPAIREEAGKAMGVAMGIDKHVLRDL